MIILLSPAKTLDYETPLPLTNFSVSAHLEKSKELMGTLKKNPLINNVNMRYQK